MAFYENIQVSDTKRLDQRHYLAVGSLEEAIWCTSLDNEVCTIVIAHRHVAGLEWIITYMCAQSCRKLESVSHVGSA